MVILYLYAQLREMSFAKCLNNVLFPALILKSDHRINLNFVVYTISGIKFQVFHYISFQGPQIYQSAASATTQD